jgi:predicted dienelactone hydrolase
VSGHAFPLVVVSHGYPGSRTFMTWLTENLASKGYVVAAIDHTDSVFGQQRAFVSTLLNRAADQTFTIDAIAGRSRDPGDFLHDVVDPSRVAVVGYSMGGYGALATAGAGYSRQGGSAKAIPGGYFDPWLADSKEFQARRRDKIKAVVAIAPWGNQPPQNNWDAAGLAGIRIPSLFIAGDQDDISGFEQGTRKAFNGAINSERYLLVFENARHNVGGNPPPPEALGNFTTRAFFDEPVWRKDRIAAINQHFITAFLDLYVKGDSSRREYLTVPVKSPNGAQAWKGFQPRWALGVELHHYAAGQQADR